MSKPVSETAGQNQHNRVRIADVARQLNLSKGTVSRALNGYSDISESTRLRVRKAAKRMGYTPLSHAQAIRTGRVRSIGLVLEVSEHDGHRPFLAEFLAGVSESASQANWTMTVATANSNEDTLRLLERLTSDRKADGFILPRTYFDDPRVRLLRGNGTPFVLYGRTGDTEGCAWYDIESEAAMTEAVRRLAALGHRRIGYAGGGDGYTYGRLRLAGYRSGLRAAGLEFDPALVRHHALDPDAGFDAAMDLLRSPAPPTALIYAVDRAALGAYAAARRLGLTIGTDISVMSYDGIPEGAFMQPPLSTFSVDNRTAGARLAELLIRRIRGEAADTLRELASASFLERGSHGAASLSSTALASRIAGHIATKGGHK